MAVDGVTVAQSMGQDPGRVFKTLVTQGRPRRITYLTCLWQKIWT